MMNAPANLPRAFAPSPQQAAVLEWVQTGMHMGRPAPSAIVVAVAGAGKTATVVNAVSHMQGKVALAAYNKAAAAEIVARLGRMDVDLEDVEVKTFHAFGFAAWRRVARGVKVDDKKVAGIMQELLIPEPWRQFVEKAVDLARNVGIGVPEICPLNDRDAWLGLADRYSLFEHLPEVEDAETVGLQHACKVLKRCIETAYEVVDFADMLYAPLVHRARFFQRDWVVVDEAQDTNAVRRLIAQKMLKAGGRFVAVGDPRQAIYGFTGADGDSLELIKRTFGCVELPLTVTFRCPQAVVAHARQWVSHIEAHSSAKAGIVREIEAADFQALGKDDFRATDAILCRKTAPLISIAYRLLVKGVPCHVEGRDIGKGLIALSKKWKVRSLDAFRDRVEGHFAKVIAKLEAKPHTEAKVEAARDNLEAVLVIIEACQQSGEQTIDAFRQRVENLFADTEEGGRASLTLATVHRSKGREWKRVFLYGRNQYMPSRGAKRPEDQAQEVNLIYVAVTRAEEELVEVVVEG